VGRPRKSINEQRSERIGVRFTLAELSFLEAQAVVNSTTITDLVRRRALKLPVTPPRVGKKADSSNAALISELNRIGVNLNQLTHAVNSGRTDVLHWEQLSTRLGQVLERLVMARDS
jgi:hypothetical protein